MSQPEYSLCILHDRELLTKHFLNDLSTNLYFLGDLSEEHFGRTIWFGVTDRPSSHTFNAVTMLYVADTPIYICLCAQGQTAEAYERLLEMSAHILPQRLYFHSSPPIKSYLDQHYDVVAEHGLHYRMTLSDTEKFKSFLTPPPSVSIRSISMDMATEISSFIFLNNPDAFFHPGLLDAGFYVGLYLKDSSTGGLDVLIATAGTHVINSAVNVAAIGNVVVSSTYRNTGYGTIATAVVCNALVSKGYRTIGLNVMESNIGAVKCYQKLGFSISCTFYETEMQKKSL